MRLLSRVEVSELRLQKTADPPRPFQLRPVPQFSASWAPVAGLLLPPYFSTSSGLPAPPAYACFAVGFPGLHPFRLSGHSGLRLPDLRNFLLSLSVPDLPSACAFSGLSTFRSRLLSVFGPVEVFTSWRLSPGIAFPFRVALLGTAGFYRARPGRHAQCHVSIRFPLSATLHFAFRRVGRPAGGFCLTGGSDYSSKIGIVKLILRAFRRRI